MRPRNEVFAPPKRIYKLYTRLAGFGQERGAVEQFCSGLAPQKVASTQQSF